MQNNDNILSEIGKLINEDDIPTEEELNWGELNQDSGLDELDTLDLDLDSNNLNLDDIDFNDIDLPEEDSSLLVDDSDLNIVDLDDSAASIVPVSEKDALEVYNYIKDESKKYDMLKTAEAILRTELIRRRYNANIQLEKQFIESLNTVSYDSGDLDKINSYIRLIQQKSSVTPDEIFTLVNINSSVQNRINDLMKEIISNDMIGLSEPMSENSIYKVLQLLNVISQEISLSLKNSSSDKEMAFEQGKYNKPTLEPSIYKKIDDVDVIYVTDKITEIVNSSLNYDNERRKYYKVEIKRAVVLNNTLTTEQIEKMYPENLTITFNSRNSDARMCVYSIRNESLSNLYKQICETKDLKPSEYIIKPFFLKRNKSLVVFSKLYYYTDFIESAVKNLLNNTVATSKVEWYKSVNLNSDYQSELFEKEELEIGSMYKTYSNQELENYLKEYIKSNRIKRKSDILKVTSDSYGQPMTYCRNILLSTIYKYVDLHEKNTGEVLTSDDIFNLYKNRIVLEYMLKSLAVMKYYVNKYDLEEFKYPDLLDLISFFQSKTGLINRLALDSLDIDSIKHHIVEYNDSEVLSLNSLYHIPEIKGVRKSRLKKNRSGSKNLMKIFDKAQNLLKSFDEKINFNNVLQVIDDNNIDEDNDVVESGERFMVNNENVKDSHKEIVKYIIKSIFNQNQIEDEDDFVDALAQKYIDAIKPLDGSNMRDAHIFLRYNHSVDLELDSELNELKREFILINLNRFKNGKGLESTECLIESMKGDYFTKRYENLLNIRLEEYKDSDFIKDLNKIILFVEELNSTIAVIDSALNNITESYIREYQPGKLLDKVCLPTKEPVELATEVLIELDNKFVADYSIKDIYNGLNKSEMFTIKRDEAFLSNVFTDKVFKVYKKERPTRFYNVVQNVFDTALMEQKEELSEVFEDKDKEILGFNTQQVLKDVEYKLKCICPSNIDYEYLISNIKRTLYYQRSGFVGDEVKSNLQEYKYSEVDPEYEEIFDITLMGKYIATLADILGFNLSIYYTRQMNRRIDEIKSNMKKLSANEMYSFTLSADRRKSNALYKAYLNSQNKNMLKNVNRDLVDFDLLTQEPKADGTGGGEFSRYNLIKEYELTDKTLSPEDSADLDYFYTILLIEKYNPEIYDYLPKPVIEYMEKAREMEDRYKNDDLFKNTRFKLKIK